MINKKYNTNNNKSKTKMKMKIFLNNINNQMNRMEILNNQQKNGYN